MNDQVEAVIERYQRLTPQQRDRLSEENTKTSLITPLFQALGWDTQDPSEMVMEAPVSGGRVDYAFRLHGVTRFYLEAKRHSADIYDIEFVRQAINYAFNKGVPWAVLTNFQRLVVFDAFALVPRESPPPRVLDLRWEDYLNTTSGIELLTKEAVERDALREQAERTGVRRRSVELQKELYQAMRDWRETLINQIAAAMGYSLEQVTQVDEAVQRLLNRLIFLRNAEDRGMSDNPLRGIFNQWRANPTRVRLADRLSALFARAATTYDSELFSTDAVIDMLLPQLGTNVDTVLGEVLTGLYYPPHSWAEYNFRDIDSDVLGAVYEQYLGHVAGRARVLATDRERQLSLGIPAPAFSVESRRQRRREQGIYYTPKWVVDYIVQETLGRWLQENGHDSEALERLAVLDPACGSGSFLIQAYETLLEHEAARSGQTADMLDRATREHILKRNIYGVDLDNQAIEIARLNLLLRMVQEEEQLPPLAENVVRGNSLIEGGEAELRPYFGEAWEQQHPLAWRNTFHEVMARGGFDVVIGNPPYVQIQSINQQEKTYYRNNYQTTVGSFDLYVPFIERAIKLTKPGGYLGFITSGKFLRTDYGIRLRKFLEEHTSPLSFIDLARLTVFEDATNYPTILICQNSNQYERFTFLDAREDVATSATLSVQLETKGQDAPKQTLLGPVWPPIGISETQLFDKLERVGSPLGRLTSIFFGTHTGADHVFIVDPIRIEDQELVIHTSNGATHRIEQGCTQKIVKGSRRLRRWHIDSTGPVLIFPYHPGTKNLPLDFRMPGRICVRRRYHLSNVNMADSRMSSGTHTQIQRITTYSNKDYQGYLPGR